VVPVQCDAIAVRLAGAVDGSRPLGRKTVRHVSSCLRCQAELARYHGLLRRLHQLPASRPDLPAGLVGDVLGALDAAARTRTVRTVLVGRRLVYAGGAAFGALVVGATVAVAVGRGRSARPLGNLFAPGGNLSNRPCDRHMAVRGMAIDRGQ
jgi:hypothetical protein